MNAMSPFERPPKKERVREAYVKRALPYFSNRGTDIFCCSEAYLLSSGFKYEELNELWKGVEPSPRKEDEDEYHFNALIADLEGAGLTDVAAFTKKYMEDGYPEKGLRAFLIAHNIPEEVFSEPPQSAPKHMADSSSTKEHAREEESYAMNIFTNYDEVVRALIAVEGEPWFEQQKAFHEHSIDGARDKAHKGSQHARSVIYGAGGWSRYFIDKKGNVVFSKSHGGRESTARAEKNGFKIEP
jgi:hypothetical protein